VKYAPILLFEVRTHPDMEYAPKYHDMEYAPNYHDMEYAPKAWLCSSNWWRNFNFICVALQTHISSFIPEIGPCKGVYLQTLRTWKFYWKGRSHTFRICLTLMLSSAAKLWYSDALLSCLPLILWCSPQLLNSDTLMLSQLLNSDALMLSSAA